jgi:LacI family transcriptional regulator
LRSTLVDIAREAGVSPATVDRVLNDRSGVRRHTRQMVLDTATRLGYIAERRQTASAETIRLRMILPMGTNAFVQSLHQQIALQAALRPELRVSVSVIAEFDPDGLAAEIREGAAENQGLGLIAFDHPTVREAIREASAAGVKVVTIASDISDDARLAYVGIDNRQAGRLAGYVLGRLLGRRPSAKIALFAGSLSYRGHEEREMGFRHIMRAEFPQFEILALDEINEDQEEAFQEAARVLDSHPDLAAIYNIRAGNQGIAAALRQRRRESRILFVGHEATQLNRDLLLDGTLDAVIDQNPRAEAREVLNILMKAVLGEPYEPHQPRLQAIFKENIPGA